MRRSIDLAIAVAGIVVAVTLADRNVAMIPLLWVAMMAIRSTREGRIADLNDLHPFAKTNTNFVLLMTLTAVLFKYHDTRAVLGISAAMAAMGYLNRWMLRRPSLRRRLGIVSGESVLIVGDLESVSRTIAEWENLPLMRVIGVCLAEADMGPEAVKGVPVLGSVSDIAALTSRRTIDVVAVHDVDKLGGLQLAKLQWALEDNGTHLSLITPMTNTIAARARVRTAGRRLMIDLSYSRPQGVVALIKSAIDRVLAGILLFLALPLVALCVVSIKATSPGPAFFFQTRVREHGRTFSMVKLRTMVVDAEARLAELADQNEVGGGLFKIKADPRITKVGAWLRRLSLDELPQLWNVVVGDMSLIGPRPALPHEVASYDQAARRRLAVKPGLTGLWQVSGRSNLSWDETVRIDSDYVDNWRPGREIQIALRTVKAVLSKDGAH
ncbi:MAG: exopolysaccharide biosynthesis polyprenyl glycosylphosphotransferase [Nocardioidaceae bacterium]|nr:exopolysaccharide biosynthesis polyprenyl glycosylphosphotransferase [Nocardioidaceae bacterium]